ncbi:peptidase M23 [Bradyrhizobium sp. SSBR45G]|uniref:M23 family peptidase n=1 Tax=unclassified Bradyrhizobium TaxID=2631580 RepID=UPI002342A092|nr:MULTISPECIES: M23 family peptidase [unclassified Bradyrhizobium]GLH75316.1 peptidase M23 [Bradyrhizobium sp. SSBR45G]GLH82897.1 peptidase M23 [Bradyrhizobium sp. SSBR45R]
MGASITFITAALAAMITLAASSIGRAADAFAPPTITLHRADWRAALDQLRSELTVAPEVAADVALTARRHGITADDPRRRPALVQLNGVTSMIFTGIGRSPVPVLLPFDTTAFLGARRRGPIEQQALPRYQADFQTDLFDAGPSGYDAVFSLPPEVTSGLPSRIFAKPVEIQITGSGITYDVADPAGGKGESVKALAAQYPDLRRFIREGYVRYAFTRFGVPYVVSIQCLDSAPRPKRLACREAYPIAERFLKALHVAGGQPQRLPPEITPVATERPVALDADFSFRPAGDIVANSGARGQSGRADRTAYSQIRFPLDWPAYVHSQSFGRRRASDKLDQPWSQYPWRDNFCEARSFNVGQCASGFGHQGQDLRPGACPVRRDGADGCDPWRQRVLAVRDGVVIRSSKQQAVTIQVNSGTEHIRFRYMHMNPTAMDNDGLLNGRALRESEPIGVVSNYLDHPNGTTRHLHFDVQLFTRDGWIWVNPYMTLIAAYERLIGGRGREIGMDMVSSSVAPVTTGTLPPAAGPQADAAAARTPN